MAQFRQAHDILKGLGQDGVYTKNTLEIALIDFFIETRDSERAI